MRRIFSSSLRWLRPASRVHRHLFRNVFPCRWRKENCVEIYCVVKDFMMRMNISGAESGAEFHLHLLRCSQMWAFSGLKLYDFINCLEVSTSTAERANLIHFSCINSMLIAEMSRRPTHISWVHFIQVATWFLRNVWRQINWIEWFSTRSDPGLCLCASSNKSLANPSQ